MEANKENLKALPLAIIGLAVAVVDVCIVQEIKRARNNYLASRAIQPWQEEFFNKENPRTPYGDGV